MFYQPESSSGAVIEPLESRQLLSNGIFPLDNTPDGAQLTYSILENGVQRTVTETSSSRSVKISGVRMTMLRTDYSDGSYNQAYISRTPSGDVLLNMMKGRDDEGRMTITLSPPLVALPFDFQRGRTHTSSSAAHLVHSNGVQLDGSTKLSLTPLRSQKVKVPAGTFKAAKMDMSMTFSMSSGSVRVVVKSVGSQWSVDGIGTIKESSTTTTRRYVNGRLDAHEKQTTYEVLKSYVLPQPAAALQASPKPQPVNAPARPSLFSSKPVSRNRLAANADAVPAVLP